MIIGCIASIICMISCVFELATEGITEKSLLWLILAFVILNGIPE